MKWNIIGRRYEDKMEGVLYEPPCPSPLTIEKQTNRETGFVAFVVFRGGVEIDAKQTMGEAKRVAERYIYDVPEERKAQA